MTSVMAPPLVNQVKTPADAASLQKTTDGQNKEQGMPRGHLRKNGSLRRKNEDGPQNGKYWNANGSFRSVLGGGGGYMQRPISIHQIPPSNNYPFAPPNPNFNFNGCTRPILDMRLKSSTLANNYMASQQQATNFLHEIYNGNHNGVGKQYFNSNLVGHGKSSLPYALPTNSWQPGGIKPPTGILCFNNMTSGPGGANCIEPRYQPHIMPSHHSPFSFNYSNNNYNYYHYNNKYYNGQSGLGWQDNPKLNAGSGGANGIYYIKNNYGDINNHVNNGAGELNRGGGPEPVKSKGPLAKRTSGDTVYFNTPPLQMGKPVGAAVASEPSIFVSPKGETYKLVSVNGTSYVVPCSPTDIITNGNTPNAMFNGGDSGFYGGGIPSTYDPYKAPSKVPTFHNTINKVSTSQIKLSSNAKSVNAFPQVHKKAVNSTETISKLEKAVSATTNVAMIHSTEPNSKDEESTISSTTNNSIDPSDKSPDKLLSPVAENDKQVQITKFSDIALNEDEKITTENYSDGSLLNSHSSLLEELKMAIDSENRVTNGGLDESVIKCKLYPEWTTSQLGSQKSLQENLIQSQPIVSDGVILGEDLKHKSVEDLNMSVLNMPLKPATRTNTVCCAIM